jgi:hypothetical protein
LSESSDEGVLSSKARLGYIYRMRVVFYLLCLGTNIVAVFQQLELVRLILAAEGSEASGAEELMAAQVAKVRAALALLDAVRRRRGTFYS